MKSLFACALLFGAGVLAGCGDDVTAPEDAAAPDLSASGDMTMVNADLAGVHMVTVSPSGALAYAPQMITIPAGDTVLWGWAAGSHTVTSGAGGTPDGLFCSGAPMQPSVATCSAETGHGAGFTYAHTFATPGTFPYFCNVHGALMNGTVVVQ